MRRRVLFSLLFFALAGCATFKPPWSQDGFREAKFCEEGNLSIRFFVRGPETENEILFRELTVKVWLEHEEYGTILVWLYYEETDELAPRMFPFSLPEKYAIQSELGEKKGGDAGGFFSIWQKFMTADRIGFVRRCLYGEE